MDVDVPDLDSPPLDQEHPPLTQATISDPHLLREALQGRALDTPWAGTACKRAGPSSPSRPSGTWPHQGKASRRPSGT